MAYVPRLTAPVPSDENYYSNKNPYVASGYPLPNCTTYAYGRWLELGIDPNNLSTGSGKDYYSHEDSYERGNRPALGDIMCFGSIPSQPFGHVAVVEEIHFGGNITISQSDFYGDLFSTLTIADDFNLYGLPFQGYIKNPNNYENIKSAKKSRFKFYLFKKKRGIIR
jgi:surface antigen